MNEIDLLKKVQLAMLVHGTKVSEVCYVINVSEWTWYRILRGASPLYASQQRKLVEWLSLLDTLKPTTPQKRLVVALHRLRMTQGQLAEKLGISQTKLSEWKHGREKALGRESRDKLMLWLENYEKASEPKHKAAKTVTALRYLRESLHLSISKLGLQIDEPYSMLARIEDCEKPCPLRVAFKLSALYGCEIIELFSESGYALPVRETRWANVA